MNCERPSEQWKRGRTLIVFALLAATAWLCWKGARDPAIPLLPPGSAEWIVYPLPPEAIVYPGGTISAEFVRSFVLAGPPARAEISWRAFRESHIFVNGHSLPELARPNGNWKEVSRIDAASYFQAGTNTITATVTNNNGPPALSLGLEIDGVPVKTDENWSVSIAGSLWRPARRAASTAKFGEGNDLHGLEETRTALRESWPLLCIFLLVAILVTLSLWAKPQLWHWLAAGAAVAWLGLFVHNAPLLPSRTGFDASQHLKYIAYVQQHKSLPSPNEGWEMFQAPLYYVLSACLLGPVKTSQPAGILIVRGLNALIGAVNIGLIFASLRLIFAGQWRKQIVGGLLAAFVPAQIYLLHYPTNETLSATLISAAFYLCLRILTAPMPTVGFHCGLGCVLGLALLSKSSAVVFLPAIFMVLAGKLIIERQRGVGIWVRTLGLPAVFLLLVAGWRYAEVWRNFGNPLVGNWDPRVTAPWWQQPGYHTARYFFTFGRAFTAPLFSGFHSFWDCFYTTLWGDSLAGGGATANSLPLWNYSLVEDGFLLAMAPTALIVTGAVVVAARCWRKPDLTLLLLAGAAGSAAFAILYMSLKLPFYSQSKCFYGLPALLPLCVFGVLGLDYWNRRGQWVRAVLSVALLVWVCNVYVSFWIRPSSPQSELSIATAEYSTGSDDESARREVALALRAEPRNESALILAAALMERKDGAKAASEFLRKALALDPRNGNILRFLGWYDWKTGQTNEALSLTERAVALEPESLQAADRACNLAAQLGDNQTALEMGRAALGIDPSDPALQLEVARDWTALGYPEEAIRQFQMLLSLKPPPQIEAQARICLARLLARSSSRPGS